MHDPIPHLEPVPLPIEIDTWLAADDDYLAALDTDDPVESVIQNIFARPR